MASDKVAVITAGGSGMGAGAVRRLAADGFHVAVLSSSGKGEALSGELGGWASPAPTNRTMTCRSLSTRPWTDGGCYITGQHLRVDGGITRSV